jgi:chloramphenicol O-acetyltransferase type B
MIFSSIYQKYKTFGRYIKLILRGVPIEVLKKAGPNFRCGKGAFFKKNENILIGCNVFMGNYVHISAPCVIKDDVLIASYIAFVGGDHRFDMPGVLINEGGRDITRPIIVEEDVWIGHGSIVRTGVTIHRGAIVAAGSLVLQSIPPCTIYGGRPAKHIKDRFETSKEKDIHLSFLEKRYGKSLAVEIN